MVLILVAIWKMIQDNTVEQVTGLINTHFVVTFTFVIHVSDVVPNALSVVKQHTSSRSIKLLYTLLLVAMNPVVRTLLCWVFLMIICIYP